MNGKSNSGKQQGAAPSGGSSGKNALILGVVGVAGLIVFIAAFNSGSPAKNDAANTAQTANANTSTDSSSSGDPAQKPILGVINPSAGPAKGPEPKKVVETIVSVATSTNEITAEQAQAFKDGLTELIRQGPASVPAIQDYLDKNVDSNYGDVKGAEELGYSSLRHALLDTLKQIGGPEAQGAELHVLQTTAEPNEVLELTNDLEQQAPGQYRDKILEAAREALDMAHNGQLGTNVERGPLYRVFQTLGASYSPPDASAPQQATQ